MEIYNEKFYDLLSKDSNKIFIREDVKTGIFLEGAKEY